MKIIIPGGSGDIGAILRRHFAAAGHEVIVLTRTPKASGETAWDGVTIGPWTEAIDGADAVINLAGRSVNCRYDAANRRAMFDSRILSTRVVGEAIAAAKRPPPVWLQASTATIYPHGFDTANDETSPLGGDELDLPEKWRMSVDLAKAWEAELDAAPTPGTRKVALRSAMTMSPDPGSIFAVLVGLARHGLGGTAGSGRQYISWIHERDFLRAVDLLLTNKMTGPVNLAAPNPLPNREFNRVLRETLGARIGLPAMPWMLEIGAAFMKTETELILKSRRVVPGRLLNAGFVFDFPHWPEAAQDLSRRLASAPRNT